MKPLASHQCGPGSNPGVDAMCGLSLLLVLPLAPRGFSPGTPVFPSPQKLTFPNSNSTRNQVDKEAQCGCATFKSLFIYLLRGYLIIFVFVDEFPVGNVCNFFLMASISVRFEEYPSKGLVKRYGGGGGEGWPDNLEMWLIKTTCPTPTLRHKND